jgi:hypothetical protein
MLIKGDSYFALLWGDGYAVNYTRLTPLLVDGNLMSLFVMKVVDW